MKQGAGDLPLGDLVDDIETSSSVSGGAESRMQSEASQIIIGNCHARALARPEPDATRSASAYSAGTD